MNFINNILGQKRIKDIIPEILAVIFLLIGIFYWGFDVDKSKSIFKQKTQPEERLVDQSVEEQTIVQLETIKQEDKYSYFFSKASESLEQNDKKGANFWLARYISSASNDEMLGFVFEYIYPLIDNHNFAPPISYLSGKYDTDFLGWFIYSTYPMWDFNDGEPEIKMSEDITFQLAGIKDGNYAAVVLGSHPMLETWSFIGLPDNENVALTSVLGNPEEEIYLSVAELEDKINEQENHYDDKKSYDKIEIDLGGHPLQHLWEPDFYDLEGDGLPEIFIRYNKANASGFEQDLDIYKIKNDRELYLFKKFTGESEGIARRAGDKIEVGYGKGKDGEGHLNFSAFILENWVYKNGDFIKQSEQEIPHILLSSVWQEYYDLGE